MGSVINGKQEDKQKQTTLTSQTSSQGWGVKDAPIPITQSNHKDKDQAQREQEQYFFTQEVLERKKQIEEWNKMNENNKPISRQQSEVQKPQNQNNDKNIYHANTMPEQKEELVDLLKDSNKNNNPVYDSNNPLQISNNPLYDSNNPLYQSTPSIFIENDRNGERQKTEGTPVFNRQKGQVYDSKVQQVFQFNEAMANQQIDQNLEQFSIKNKSLAESVYVNNDSQTQHQQIQENSVQRNSIMVESQAIKNSENQNKQPISFMPDSQKVQQPDNQKQLTINIEKQNAEREEVFGTQIPGVSPDLQEKKQIENNSIRNTTNPFGSQIEGESPRIAFDSLPYKDIKFLQIFNDLPKIIQEILQEKGLYKPKELKKNEKIVIKVLKQPDGSRYEGELENNQRHGYGMFWCNDEFYEGYFEKNERKGWGRIINLKKELKQGYWDQKSIQKEMYYETDQLIFDGQSRNSLPHGRGILERKGQFKYEGTFSDGKLSGQGIKRNFVDKTSYEGEFYNDVIQGYGTFKFSNGKRYQGQFLSNKFHGNGEMFWPDGRYYKGQFLNNFRHGQGYYRDSDGSTYEGGWINDKKHGMGKAVANGLELVGQWIDDVFQEE